MGLQSLFADCNLKLQLSLHTDSSSAKAVASRRGAGKSTRHMQTSRRKEWSDRTSCEDGETRNPGKSRSSRKPSLQLNGWKRVMQGSRTSRRMQNCDGCILWIESSKMVESGDMDKLWKQQASLNLLVWLWLWLELRSAREGSESLAHGMATYTPLGDRRVS